MAKIAVIGTGYVGLVTGACLSDFGHEVICMDNNESKIQQIEQGKMPIYESGLDAIIERNRYYKRLSFTTSMEMAIKSSDVIFIAVGTPQADDGRADMMYFDTAIDEIAPYVDSYKVIINKSTVPVGTGKRSKEKFSNYFKSANKNIEVDIVSNPEFLREGRAVHDFTVQDRVVIGSDSERAIEVVKNVYRVLYLNETPFIITSLETAEMIKYTTNAFLAMKITFINEIANLCEAVGANVQEVAKALGKDGRISSKFLHAGAGYGGSCFPKDTKAITAIAEDYGVNLSLVKSTIRANDRQKIYMAEKIEREYDSLKGKTFCVLGISFKPNTDDIREAPAIEIMKYLIDKEAVIQVYDPIAMDNAKRYFDKTVYEENIHYCENEYEAMRGCEGLIIVTEWNAFRMLDFERMKKLLSNHYVFDLRNIYNKKDMIKEGFHYIGVGQ